MGHPDRSRRGGTYLQGSTVTVSANGYAPTGIDSMTLQYDASTPGTTWVTTSCTDNGAPYTCNWNTLNVPSGTTTLRIAMNRTGGGTTYSSTSTITIEQLRAFDVQATNASNQGQPATGDTITMYYSTTVNLGTIRAGWNGSIQSTTVTFNDRQVGSPLVANADYLSFAGGINLGQVALGLDYVQATRSVGFNATMSAATVSYQGRTVTAVTITLGTQTGGNWFTDQNTTGGTLRWTAVGDGHRHLRSGLSDDNCSGNREPCRCRPVSCSAAAETKGATMLPTMARVLVVEDEEDIAFPLVRTLEREGYTVTWVEDGEAALERLQGDEEDVVILDLGLPDMDGLEVCRRARDAGYERRDHDRHCAWRRAGPGGRARLRRRRLPRQAVRARRAAGTGACAAAAYRHLGGERRGGGAGGEPRRAADRRRGPAGVRRRRTRSR